MRTSRAGRPATPSPVVYSPPVHDDQATGFGFAGVLACVYRSTLSRAPGASTRLRRFLYRSPTQAAPARVAVPFAQGEEGSLDDADSTVPLGIAALCWWSDPPEHISGSSQTLPV